MDYAPALPVELRRNLSLLYRADEQDLVAGLLHAAALSPEQMSLAQKRAQNWITHIRGQKKPLPGIAEMLSHFGLNSREGVALMCLAEALLRIPDTTTADALIRDKLNGVDFEARLGADTPWFLRAAGWTLNLTGQLAGADDPQLGSARAMLGLLSTKLSQAPIREAIRQGMRWLGDQFVLGTSIDAALARAAKLGNAQARFSYDMLGEAARTAEDAEHYTQEYLRAIKNTGAANRATPANAPSGVSIKLSALHPRYEATQARRVYVEMVPRLIALVEAAAAENIFLVIDAEEADRLLLSLGVIEKVLLNGKLGDWRGLGLAVQAYSKRAPAVIDSVAWLAEKHGRPLTVRLIKGAYWDTEIKRAQERGWNDFPVFTRKITTDVSYLACARRLLAQQRWLTPVFGSHNALTIASILAIAPDPGALEFQRLQGMGEELFARLNAEGLRTCVYAPVGNHEVLLSYLVRRLLENGANSSFVNQLSDPRVPVQDLIADPVAKLKSLTEKRHPSVTLPHNIYRPERLNSSGLDLTDPDVTGPLLADMQSAWAKEWVAAPVIDGVVSPQGIGAAVDDPGHTARHAGKCYAATSAQIAKAFIGAEKGYVDWSRQSVEARAVILEKFADLLEKNSARLMALLVREGGKTIPDSLSEVREAVDFCRYYAARARHDCAPVTLPGPTGELNTLTLHGRGIFVCISPWNFPLAIFLGQIVAALAMGNSVIAKPAPQTPLVAAYAVTLAHEAGIPVHALQFLPGGTDVGSALVEHPRVAGVVFTGSIATARRINRMLAAKDGSIVPLIAETGGQNAMIADSSALPEQIIDDVLTSAFRSAGQRCSALRVLCLPHATADQTLKSLAAALREMMPGDPGQLRTDIGPVIDAAALARLQDHVVRLRAGAREVYTLPLPAHCAEGTFFSPQIWEIPHLNFLTGEVFGPILHVARYAPEELSQLITAINATGFGLTGGVHSRINTMTDRVANELQVGNLYINRSMIGAVVGTQPFGGEGLSGTGPKAGGPHYLPRFAVERTLTINTTAAGGNASLLSVAGT
ncbi:MAG: bifunctional proline dehydrogenase/L-glutamate gamma-semialdehyde dehydrogenase PutA [Alphaproteobacteria bacterium]